MLLKLIFDRRFVADRPPHAHESNRASALGQKNLQAVEPFVLFDERSGRRE
jgi:hypothetical protein